MAIVSFNARNIFSQQGSIPTFSTPATQSVPTPTTTATTPSLQSGSFWSSGPPKSDPTPKAPAPTPAQPMNPVSPAMPSLNPPANDFAPNNVPSSSDGPVNSSAYGSGVNLPPASGSPQPSTSVYGSSTPLSPASTGPALAPPSNSQPPSNNSLPPLNNSPAPNANSFPQPQPSLPPASNFGQSPIAQSGSPQNPFPPAQPTQNPASANDVFQNPLLPNVAPTNQQLNATPQFNTVPQPTGQPQFGEQNQPLNPSQFTAQGINQPVGGTTLQSAPTIATWGEFETAKTIAMVGGEPIISYDIEEYFIRGMEAARAENPNAPPPSEEEKKAYTKIILKKMIETKILYADALKNVPKETLEKMRSGVKEKFESDYIKHLLEKNNVKTRADLEKVMIKKGTSLERESQKFFEQSLADMWERQNVKKISVVPLADVVSYYTTHMAEYEYPAKARWEQLMISFDKVRDKAEAQNKLAMMGNRVIQGASFGEIAEKESHGPTAYNKGQYDWTSKDALKSKVLNDAIFSLPVNQLSVILEDENGYHIIRVLERKEAGCVPFEEAQVAIRKNLIDEEQKKIKDAYIKKVKERIAVWTIFDNEKPAGEIAKEQDPLRK